MKIKPLGFYVLIEMEEIRQEGLIELPEDIIKREQSAVDVGYVRAIGPTAYHGYPGCEPMGVSNQSGEVEGSIGEPHECWGLEIGQKIEYRKFEGKASAIEGHENYRYIPDSHIIGAINDE